jgi:hypothetical protein
MGYSRESYGWEAYGHFLKALTVMGTPYTEEPKEEGSRIAHFMNHDGRRMVVEEYVYSVAEWDSGDVSLLGIRVYEEGHRPELVRVQYWDDSHDIRYTKYVEESEVSTCREEEASEYEDEDQDEP